MINELFIPGLIEINLKYFKDNRGNLLKPYTQNALIGTVYENLVFRETWFTYSEMDVIRAMHLQLGEFPCEKLVSPIKGKILDVILDIRKESPTYGKVWSAVIDANQPRALLIPIGCAHGYRVLEPDTIVLYQATAVHSAKDDIGVRWDSFGFDWGLENPIISERDLALPPFQII